MKCIILGIAAIVMFGCTGTQNSGRQSSDQNETENTASSHTSQNSLDWEGTYHGILPCEDCEGIQTTISLNKNLSYSTRSRHLGKSGGVVEDSGKFIWNEKGNTIALAPAGSGKPVQYFVGENTITRLDSEGKKIEDENATRYILSKSNYEILEKYWKLVELNGKPVAADSTSTREVHIIFKEADNRVTGSGGCNRISGSYKVESLNRITISKVISTKMACPRMDLEDEFLKVLNTVDNFNVVGDTLTLNKARMAPLARFNAVYMK